MKTFSLALCGMALLSIGFGFRAFAGDPIKPLSREDLALKLRAYGAFQELEVAFTQNKTLKEMGLQLQSEGQLTLIRPSKVRWEVTKPSPVAVSVDEETIKMEIGSGSGVQRQVLKRSQLGGSQGAERSLSELVAWLNMDANELDRHYAVYPDGEGSYRFQPREKGMSAFQSLKMQLSTEGYLKKLTIEELSGDILEIAFGRPRVQGKASHQ